MRVLLLVAALLAASPALADERNQCLRDTAQRAINVTGASGGIAQNVLCCCGTSGGGQCCKYVSMCMGTFIPGCFCSGHKNDAPREVLSTDKAG
jgi:hypothetical protein